MEGLNIEKINNEEKAPEKEKLTNYLEKTSETLKEREGIPLTSECRVDENEYVDVYSQQAVKEDLEKVNRTKKILAEKADMSLSEWEINRQKSNGNKFEELKTAVYNKNSDGKLIVVRSSEYDDFVNGVDNIMIDKRTGNVVCAIDEIVDDEGESKVYKNKERNIAKKNKQGGVDIKYGFTYKNGEDKATLDRVRNVPIFSLSLSRRELQQEIRKFEKGDQEKELFVRLNKQISKQVNVVNLGDERISEADIEKYME